MYINYKYKNPIFKNRNGFMIGDIYNQSGGVSNFFSTLGRCVGLDYGKYPILIGGANRQEWLQTQASQRALNADEREELLKFLETDSEEDEPPIQTARATTAQATTAQATTTQETTALAQTSHLENLDQNLQALILSGLTTGELEVAKNSGLKAALRNDVMRNAEINNYKDIIKNKVYEKFPYILLDEHHGMRYWREDRSRKVFDSDKFISDFNNFPSYIKTNPEVVLEAVTRYGEILKHVNQELKDNKKIVLAAVKNQGEALEWASPGLQNDEEVVLTAIASSSKYDKILPYASSKLKDKKEIVLAAMEKNSNNLKYASERLKADKDLVFIAISNNDRFFREADPSLFDDREFVLKIIKKIPIEAGGIFTEGVLEFASPELKADKEIILAYFHHVPRCRLRYVSPDLRDDKEVVLAAIKKDNTAFDSASPILKNDEDIIQAHESKWSNSMSSSSRAWIQAKRTGAQSASDS